MSLFIKIPLDEYIILLDHSIRIRLITPSYIHQTDEDLADVRVRLANCKIAKNMGMIFDDKLKDIITQK